MNIHSSAARIASDVELPTPFLRWAGSKKWFLKRLPEFLPQSPIRNYYEPFLGGASVFFYLRPNGQSYLTDSNSELVNTYNQVRDNCEALISSLKQFNNSKEDYYKIRSTVYENELAKAAQFIFLNKTSFNGIYRVNSKGLYNVPYGAVGNIDFVNAENLRSASLALKNAIIRTQDFEDILNQVQERDLVFLDPPYTVAHENNGFREYNQKIFSWEDQERLAGLVKALAEKGAYYILTNAAHDSLKELYIDICQPQILSRKSTVGGKGARRGEIHEFVFTNCK